ncbi:histidinol-phosphatase [Helicobacter burdigaliensis]|uniref:histidinol-phosphatase n=1 Tax=Helicobacter burdigaliensis TaxID=2315334 RepID=UPI000EF75523|nr:histidinol-phosphatase [Helicobacter burdigaliensis]
MRVDLHNHTSLCNHASGSMEEYVLKAIEEKIDIFGFSCHNPMEFDKEYRMKKSEVEGYLKEIQRLQEKYKDKITLKAALEIDYLPKYLDKSLFGLDLDYTIGAVHFLDNWGFDNPEFIKEYAKRDINLCWEQYFEATIALAKSGLFDIVAHMDLLKVFNHRPTKDLRSSLEKTLKEIKKANMVVEINASGLRKEAKEQYPSLEILQMCYEFDIPITFGSDAHSIEHIGFKRKELEELAKSIGFSKCATFTKRDRELVSF